MKTASEIVDYALTLIDEQVTDIDDAASTEMSVKEMALEILPVVCRELVKELPYELKRYLAETAVLTIDTLSDGEIQSAYTKKKVAFLAPAGFLELVSIRLTVWSRTVTSYILIDSPEYIIQNNPFTRSGKQNPSVAISNEKTGSDARIECFSIHNTDVSTVADFEYISFDNVPDDLGNSWPDELFNEITKALTVALLSIKTRNDESKLRSDETLSNIEQYE